MDEGFGDPNPTNYMYMYVHAVCATDKEKPRQEKGGEFASWDLRICLLLLLLEGRIKEKERKDRGWEQTWKGSAGPSGSVSAEPEGGWAGWQGPKL